MKKYIGLLFVFTLALSAVNVLAEENSGTPLMTREQKEAREAEIRAQKDAMRLKELELKRLREEEMLKNKNLTREQKEALELKIKQDRAAFEAELKLKREEFKNATEAERKALMEKLKAEREKFKTELQTKKEEFRKTTLEKKKEFGDKAKRMIGERFEAAVANMKRFQERVEEVITKLKEAGHDTSTATSALDASKTKLGEAEKKIAEVKALIPENGETITPELFEQIKLKAREAKDLLKETHEALKDAIQAIKDLRNQSDNDDGEEDDDNDDSNDDSQN